MYLDAYLTDKVKLKKEIEMGGLRQIPIDDAIDQAEDKQQEEREQDAYESGRNQHDRNEKNPSNDGGPASDGYGSMSDGEKEAYKRGHRGG